MTYEELQKANATIRTMDVRGKDYADVAQRVIAFRKVYPQGTIRTEMVTNEGDTGRRYFKGLKIHEDSGAEEDFLQ